MKIKLYTVVKIWLYFLLFINLGFTKISPNFFGIIGFEYGIKWINTVSSLCLLLLIALFSNNIYSKTVFEKCRILLLLLITFLVIHVTNSITRYGNTAFDAISAMQEYVWILLAFPMMYVMLYEYYKGCKNKFINFVCLLTTISCAFRGIIAIVHAFTGITIWEALANEYIIPNSMRNGLLRVNPSSLGICIIVFLITIYLGTRSVHKKYLFLCCILINVLFQFFVNMSRIDEIIYIILIVLAFYWQKSKRKSVIWRVIIIFAGLILLSSSVFWDFVDSFNSANVETGGSTIARLATIEYHMTNLLNHPITGWGALDLGNSVQMNLLRGPSGRYYLEDVGMLAIIFNYGFIGLILFVGIFGMIVYRCKHLARTASLQNNISELYFARGIVIFLLVFSVAHNIFGSMYAFSLPLIFASVSYRYAVIKEEIKSR